MLGPRKKSPAAVVAAGLRRLTSTGKAHASVSAPIDPDAEAHRLRQSMQPQRAYTFHCGRGENPMYTMKDENDWQVAEAITEHSMLLHDTAYRFRDHINGRVMRCRVGRTMPTDHQPSAGRFRFQTPIAAAFTVDGQSNWDMLTALGCSFTFNMRGLSCWFDVQRWGVSVGSIELPSTSGFAYADSSIMNVLCRPDQLDLLFLTCVCIVRTGLRTV